MAIIIEKEKKGISIMTVFVAVGIALAIFGATYFLFFAPVPVIDRLSTPTAQKATQISNITFDRGSIENSLVLRALTSHIQLASPVPSDFGRVNPFLSLVVVQQAPATTATTGR